MASIIFPKTNEFIASCRLRGSSKESFRGTKPTISKQPSSSCAFFSHSSGLMSRNWESTNTFFEERSARARTFTANDVSHVEVSSSVDCWQIGCEGRRAFLSFLFRRLSYPSRNFITRLRKKGSILNALSCKINYKFNY